MDISAFPLAKRIENNWHSFQMDCWVEVGPCLKCGFNFIRSQDTVIQCQNKNLSKPGAIQRSLVAD